MDVRRHIVSRARGVIAAALLLCAGGPAVAAPSPGQLLPDSLRRAGRISLATDAHYAPCESLAPDNRTIVGFEPDIWNALGAKLGVKMDVTSTAFSGLIPGVQSGRYQLAMECIADTPVREGRVTFVDFAYATTSIYTLASNRTVNANPLSLCGLRTAAQIGTDSVDSLGVLSTHCVKNHRPPLRTSLFPSADAMFSAMIAGRIDFLIDDTCAEPALRAQLPVPIRLTPDPLLPRSYTGIVVLPSSGPLAQALLAALKAIQADGTYGRIMQKWGIGALALNDPGINLATHRPLPAPQP
jgi:polar amino acid transport system substrate-binding protein